MRIEEVQVIRPSLSYNQGEPKSEYLRHDGVIPSVSFEPILLQEEVNDCETKIVDAEGKTISIVKKGARSSLYLYLIRALAGNERPTRPEIWEMDPETRASLMNQCIQKLQKTFEIIYYPDGSVDAITTTKHKQIGYSEVLSVVEDAVTDVFPETEFFDRGLERYATYKVPTESKYVTSWVGIDAGVNKPKGRCAIYLYTRFEVTWRGQDGLRTPCHKVLRSPETILPKGQIGTWNWAFWVRPANFFGIDLNRLPGFSHYSALDNLTTKAIHTKGTQIKKEELTETLKNIKDATKGIDPIVEDTMNAPLHMDEMKAIISAYEETVGLPKYIAELIIEHIEDMNLWGLSNAVSWVRTHGDLKAGKIENREEKPIIGRLENISGELMTLGPALKAIKERVKGHMITKDILLNPKEGMFDEKVLKALQRAEKAKRDEHGRFLKVESRGE